MKLFPTLTVVILLLSTDNSSKVSVKPFVSVVLSNWDGIKRVTQYTTSLGQKSITFQLGSRIVLN